MSNNQFSHYNEFEDRTLNCCDCHKDFVFDKGEQEFFQRKEFSDPRRCKPCRVAKKTRNNQENDGRQNSY